jgi:D-cysteine desulfhydrase
MHFTMPDCMELALLPTPIERLDRLSDEVGGPNFFVKRDDLTGSALSGNKVRKLEFSFGEALARGADTVITCGGVQSNHCRTTTVAARQLGLRPVLYLRGERPEVAEGNLLLDEMFGAEVRYITAEQYKGVRDLMRQGAEELTADGAAPYIIPEGASNAIGSFGYISAVEEIAASEIQFDAVVHACGSGGTAAGLIAGKHLHGLEGQVFSFSVCDDLHYFTAKIRSILSEMVRDYEVEFDPAALEVNIVDGYKGRGYALNQPEEIQFIRHIAKLEGLILDPVYSGKAMLGMVDQARKGMFAKGSNVLFIHTGGIYGLMAKAGEIAQMV